MKLQMVSCLVALVMMNNQVKSQVVYDAAIGFSNINLDGSLWSYRQRPDDIRNGIYPLLGNYDVFTNWTAPPGQTLMRWSNGTASGSLPLVSANTTGSDLGSGSEIWPTGTLLVHPGFPTAGLGPAIVVVSWLCPQTDVYRVDFQFSSLDAATGTDGVSWFVERNSGADTLGSGAFLALGTSGPMTLSNVSVNMGDRLNFIVNSNMDLSGDSTMLRASITAVPEPSSLILVLCSAGIARRTWRKTRVGISSPKR